MQKSPKLDISYVAELARIKLSQGEKEKFGKQLGNVLAQIEQLKEPDLKNASSTFQTTGSVDVTREDKLEPERTFTQEEALSSTKESERGFFRVPYVWK